MARHFNIAGPCRPGLHYMLPAAGRLPGLADVVERQEYFVVHAPRQSGKTTVLLTLARDLTATGRYAAVVVSVETGNPFGGDVEKVEEQVLAALRFSALDWLPAHLQPPSFPDTPPGSRLRAALQAWARACPLPLVILFDEVGSLEEAALTSILRQIRSGFPARPEGFPQSVALVGMRDVRDYKAASGGGASPGSDRGDSGSPFNIKVASFTLGNFTVTEVAELYGQHAAATGQAFHPDAIARAAALSGGQPWLVNALARACVMEIAPPPHDGTPGRTVDAVDVEQAAETIIRRIDSHLDSLDRRLREPRVRAVIAPILQGIAPDAIPAADVRYAIDLGLVTLTPSGGLDISNPIYRQVIPRELEAPIRLSAGSVQTSWLTAEGLIDPHALMVAFLDFWRRQSGALSATAPYHEVAAQLVLMAFLDRVANGGGWVDREYAIGRGRIDLWLRWGKQRLAYELKTWRPGESDPLEEGLLQLDGYLSTLGLEEGWLVIFDQRPSRTPPRMVPEAAPTPSGRHIRIVRA